MSSTYIAAIDAQAQRVPDKTAFCNSRGEAITYAQLKQRSDALARWMTAGDSLPAGAPIVVYGHKSPLMLVCFLACVKSGHAYVPIDVVYPRDRIASIIGQLGATAVFDTIGTIPELLDESELAFVNNSVKPLRGDSSPSAQNGRGGQAQDDIRGQTQDGRGGQAQDDIRGQTQDGRGGQAQDDKSGIAPDAGSVPESGFPYFDADDLKAAIAGADNMPCAGAEIPAQPAPVGQNDTFYILFTSGSTGTPKGVEITTECVDNFSDWLLASEFAVDEERTWFNRSPFTFDVSLTDMAAGLTRGDTLFALEDEAEKGLALAFELLGESDITEWVSTPSFVDQCLADPSFDAKLLPRLKRMLLAGEVLRPETVRMAQERFPGLRVFNGYGPTESTDLVSLCEILPEMLQQNRSLPIGYAKMGTQLLVLDPETMQPLPDGEHGELFVIGNTVAKGYWGRDDLTQAAFHACPNSLAQGMRTYRTGDEVTRDPDGLYYYHGRYDLQIKLHGYRIELGDIEASLCALPEVHMACVLPFMRDGAISHLVALVVPADPSAPTGFALTKQLKRAVREMIPSYMVPRTFKYVDEFPLNPSGKADRKALAALIAE